MTRFSRHVQVFRASRPAKRDWTANDAKIASFPAGRSAADVQRSAAVDVTPGAADVQRSAAVDVTPGAAVGVPPGAAAEDRS
jgi:hypothetical protein